MASSSTPYTLFDAVTSHARIAETRAFLTIGLGTDSDRGAYASALMRWRDEQDLMAFGDVLGDTLREHLGAENGLQAFAVFSAAVLRALDGHSPHPRRREEP
ncbi:hypothetical protein [Sulfobacillus thermosulfidooxidans]|uniref:hypothetical protein n=1 Tax=Sulfobacillus thermosulfidooxidans TaxID=28034 RepID=UPI0002FD10CB|nr:hypothetical protein [Sulfobacillus thermosulfidooxidans]